MSSRQKGHQWRPIEDLSADLRSRRFPELDALITVFEGRRSELESAGAVREFVARMVRSWSIETGILERLYTLSESATLTLVEQGFDAALIFHGDSDLAPGQVVAILRDHQDAAEGLFEFVRGGRVLSTSYIKELHQVFTRHQPTCDAMDSQGNWVKVQLRRGDWKLMPNNPGDVTTGEVWHQYCPPEQVASEMDSLIAMQSQHGDVHYVVDAAWLHHRFTQIHPFQDGNGRVARALASLVSIRAGGFPVVVLRKQKDAYIRALEQADRGDLVPLVSLFERQQREAFMRAVGLSQQVIEQNSTVDAIVADAKQRLEEGLRGRSRALAARSNQLADITFERLQGVARTMQASLGELVQADVYRSDSATEHWFKGQIVQAARSLGYYANFLGSKAWVHLRLRGDDVTSFLVAFHHTGRVEDGVMVVTALVSRRESSGDGAEGSEGVVFATQPSCDEPMSFTAGRDQRELRQAFSEWLERAITIGLDLWRRDL